MAFSISIPSISNSTITVTKPTLNQRKHHFPSLTFLLSPIPLATTTTLPLFLCHATRSSQTGPVKKRSSSPTSKKRKKKDKGDSKSFGFSDVEIVRDYDSDETGPSDSGLNSAALSYHPATLPKRPAGFVVDDHGKALMVSNKRIAAIILKSTNIDGWSAVSDKEVEALLPSAAYVLAKIHMHLVHSGYCYTARGGFYYSDDDIFDFRTDDGQDLDGLPTEGVEITCFHLVMPTKFCYKHIANQLLSFEDVYPHDFILLTTLQRGWCTLHDLTPSDPLLFVAVKNSDGLLQITDDELLEDPAIISAIDEETEFNALVEEEAFL